MENIRLFWTRIYPASADVYVYPADTHEGSVFFCGGCPPGYNAAGSEKLERTARSLSDQSVQPW